MDELLASRTDSLRLSLLEFSRALSSSHGTVNERFVGCLAELQAAMRSLGDIIQASCEVSALARLPMELQVRILSRCSAKTLCRVMATARGFRTLVLKVEPAAAEAQYAAAASLRPPMRTPLMRLRWLEDAAEYAKNWSAHCGISSYNQGVGPRGRTCFPRYAGADAEAGGFMLAVARFKLEAPLQPETRPASPCDDYPPEPGRVLDLAHPEADADFVSCVRVALIVIDPGLAEDVHGLGVPKRRADALTWLGEQLSRDDLSPANCAYAIAQAEELVQPVEEGGRTALRGNDSFLTSQLPLDARPLLRGLWLASRRLHGAAAANTVRRGLAYASFLDRCCAELAPITGERSPFDLREGDRARGDGGAGDGAERELEETRAERLDVLREAWAAQQVDSVTWPAPHRFLTICALTKDALTWMLPGSEPAQLFERLKVFEDEYSLICQWLATAQDTHATGEMKELYCEFFWWSFRDSLHQGVRSTARALLQLFSDGADEHAGKLGHSPSPREFELAEGLLRRKLRLLQLHKEALGGESDDVDVASEMEGCEMQLAMLLAKSDSGAQLVEAKSLMQRATCVWRERVSTGCAELVERRRQYSREHQIDENDVTTWPLGSSLTWPSRSHVGDRLRAMSRFGRYSEELYGEEVHLVLVLCDLIAVSRRLAEFGAVDDAVDRDEPTRALTHEVITRYHTLAVGDDFFYQEPLKEVGHECRRWNAALLRTTVAKVVGMEQLFLGAEAMQRARVEAHTANVGATHDRTLHSACLLGLLLVAHGKIDAGCDCLREAVEAYGTYGFRWKLRTSRLWGREAPPIGLSLRDESASFATDVLDKALIDAGKGDEAEELRRKREAEMLALTADSEQYAFERLHALMRDDKGADAELLARRSLQAARQRLEAARAETQAAAAEAQTVTGQHAAAGARGSWRQRSGVQHTTERSAGLNVVLWASNLAHLLSRSEDAAVLAEAEQLVREVLGLRQSDLAQYGGPPSLFNNDVEVVLLAGLLAKQRRFDEGRLLLRGQLARCSASDAHVLHVSLFWLLLGHARELRAELEVEEEQAEEEDAAARTALSLKWSARADRLAQAAQLMLGIMAVPGEERGTTVSLLSGTTRTMSHMDCARMLEQVRAEQAADDEYRGEDDEYRGEDDEYRGEDGVEDGEASGDAARAAGEGSIEAAMETVVVAPSQLNEGNDADSDVEGPPAKRQRAADREAWESG